jgi:NADP-dependent 3-hydroxy acid dehydrogenase YdfG
MNKIINKSINSILIYILISTIINILNFSIDILKFINIKKINLLKIYGKKSWIIITGASSGQGRDYSLEFAKKGFNVLMIGNEGCVNTEIIINKKYPEIKTEVIIKDLSLSYKEDYFNDVKLSIQNKDISGLVSNVGNRYGINPYYKIKEKKIIEIIATKSITQSILVKLLLEKFIKRKNKKSFIIIISALVKNKSSIYDSDNINTLPFMSIYEGINAYSYFHAKTIFEEFKNNPKYKNIDYLNITPAAVITQNTNTFLKNVPFSVKSKYFVKKSIGLLNKYNGTTCGCIEHLIAYYLGSLLPIKYIKDKIEYKIGNKIAKYYS